MPRNLTNSNTTLSIKEARKLLGKDSELLSDTQIYEIITTLQMMARKYLHSSGSRN